MPLPSTTRLEIVRDHPQDIQDRPVYLWVDGEKWEGVLRYGATFTRELPPGRHLVKAHNTLFGYLNQHDLDVQRTNPWHARSQGLNLPHED